MVFGASSTETSQSQRWKIIPFDSKYQIRSQEIELLVRGYGKSKEKKMFVANWEPGVISVKLELTSAPIWLEQRKVPFQFFNEEGLEHIAGLVTDPKYLHPSITNKTNLEVAKLFTIIDPRKPLPEAINV